MRDKLEARLEELRQQFGQGKQRLDELEAEAADLRQTLLRISGAIQVLEETLEDKASDEDGAAT
jgi:uncharacterized coiled-coil protein SlyX